MIHLFNFCIKTVVHIVVKYDLLKPNRKKIPKLKIQSIKMYKREHIKLKSL